MAALARKPKLLIAREASDLAFGIGQGVERAVLELARCRAAKRNAEVVGTADIVGAAGELGIAAATSALNSQVHGDEADAA